MSPTSLLRGIAFLLLLQWVSTLIINALGVPFPPALLGMLILTALLCGNVIPASSIEGICDILISKMGMLFLTAGVSVILYVDVIKAELLPITVTIIVCSVVVLRLLLAFFIKQCSKERRVNDAFLKQHTQFTALWHRSHGYPVRYQRNHHRPLQSEYYSALRYCLPSGHRRHRSGARRRVQAVRGRCGIH